MIAVVDTSPLQALWRGGVLPELRQLFETTVVPDSVADETRWSRLSAGPQNVPNLPEYDWISIEAMQTQKLVAAMQPVFLAYWRRRRGKSALCPNNYDAGVIGGRVKGWVGKTHFVSMKVPDLAVVVLARELGGIAVLDDRRALRAAADLGVPTATTRELLCAMRDSEFIDDVAAAVVRIEATGYFPLRRPDRPWPPAT